MVKITRGKVKGMKAVANRAGVISAAAMDQRGSLRNAIAAKKNTDPKHIKAETMSDFKVAVSKVLTPHASSILLDPEFGLKAVKAAKKGTGILLAYEETGYDNTQPGRHATLIPHWTVRDSIKAGADAIKLLIYYTPFEKKEINAAKHAFVERIGQECIARDIPFFLEFVGYDVSPANDAKSLAYAKLKPQIVGASMKEFSKEQYAVDVLKVEIPVNLAYTSGTEPFIDKGVAYTKKQAMQHYIRCSKVATKPFIYLSAGVSDAEFRENLNIALEASVPFNGILCGRATWQDGIPVFAKDGAKPFTAWLEDQGVKNIKKLNRILRNATPWHETYGGLKKINVI